MVKRREENKNVKRYFYSAAIMKEFGLKEKDIPPLMREDISNVEWTNLID